MIPSCMRDVPLCVFLWVPTPQSIFLKYTNNSHVFVFGPVVEFAPSTMTSKPNPRSSFSDLDVARVGVEASSTAALKSDDDLLREIFSVRESTPQSTRTVRARHFFIAH